MQAIYIIQIVILCLAASCPLSRTTFDKDTSLPKIFDKDYSYLKKTVQELSGSELDEEDVRNFAYALREQKNAEKCQQFVKEAIKDQSGITLAYLLRLGVPITSEQLHQDDKVFTQIFHNVLENGNEQETEKCLEVIKLKHQIKSKCIFSDPEVQNIYDFALNSAICGENLPTIELILQHGFNPNHEYIDKLPLEQANELGDKELIDILLKFGADPRRMNDIRPDNHELCPYIYQLLYKKGSRYYHQESVDEFINNNVEDGELLIAVRLGDISQHITNSIKASGRNYIEDHRGYNLLMYAVLSDSPEAVLTVMEACNQNRCSGGKPYNPMLVFLTNTTDTALDIAYKCMTRSAKFKNSELIVDILKNAVIKHAEDFGERVALQKLRMDDYGSSQRRISLEDYKARINEEYKFTEYDMPYEPWDS